MTRRILPLFLLGALLIVPMTHSRQDEKPAKQQAKEKSDFAALKELSQRYAAAFAKADVKAIVATWLDDGQFVGADGSVLEGRKAIETAYTAFFKANPKATIEVTVESQKYLGRGTAVETGLLRLKTAGKDEPEVTRYSAVFVREDGKWLTASVRETDVDPAELVSVKDMAWMVGEWTAKGEETDVSVKYAFDESKNWLIGRYEVRAKGKTVFTGSQRFGKDPAGGGIKLWVFESTGGYGEASYVRDGKRWVAEAADVLPDGDVVTSSHVLIPLGPDAFTFQVIERKLDEVDLPDLAPMKVTRVKK